MIAAVEPEPLSICEERQAWQLALVFADRDGLDILRKLVRRDGCSWRVAQVALDRIEAALGESE